MSGSALLWAALNLRLAASPGLRRRLNARAADPAAPLSLPQSAGEFLGPGWQEEAAAELERARRFGAGVLTLADEAYPSLLRAAADPPPLLYVWGRLLRQDALAVAVVGSRRATPHGSGVARRLAEGLAGAGFTVVSGLARGIDAEGHRGALECGGRTLAVLGSGLDRIYPVEHQKLAAAISGQGAVLTEFPFGTGPLPRHFPERNRVIAWLSWATVVVEAARDSGSLITADLAADEGRAVYAVPGPVGCAESEGTNALLRQGAIVCRGAEDLLEDLAPQLVEAARLCAPAGRDGDAEPGEGGAAGSLSGIGSDAARRGLTADQRRLLERLPKTRGVGVERLAEVSGLPPGALLSTLLELEVLGLVRQLPGLRFMASG
ncbi:MAG TPA: DNA-processing protein DprA [Candidatus Polarisedimenticolia bacterium]|nr:DNA-processing protein DprA [Candidatus Polarisedimenticolia bacterium]